MQHLILRPGPQLVMRAFRPEPDDMGGRLNEVDVTGHAHELLFELITIHTETTLADIFRLMEASPLLQKFYRRLSRNVARKQAMEMLFTGEMIPAARAREIGLVNRVVPAEALRGETLKLAQLIAATAMAGLLIGLAMSTFYYPFFLLPLWLSFYWQRGVMRFLTGLLVAVGAMVASLAFISSSTAEFWTLVQAMFGLWMPKVGGLEGIWASYGWDPIYRLPVIAACVALGGSLALWPAQKNLGTLLSCSAAIMIAIQFWHGHGDGGGMYLAWFLPLALLTVFRPNLEDRVALTVLGEDWFTRRRAKLAQSKRTSGSNKGSIAAFSPVKFPATPPSS